MANSGWLFAIRHPLCALERWRGQRRSPIAPTAAQLALHDSATARGLDHYVDPGSGRLVYTAAYLLRLGRCCELACRHCPYEKEPAVKGQGFRGFPFPWAVTFPLFIGVYPQYKTKR